MLIWTTLLYAKSSFFINLVVRYRKKPCEIIIELFSRVFLFQRVSVYHDEVTCFMCSQQRIGISERWNQPNNEWCFFLVNIRWNHEVCNTYAYVFIIFVVWFSFYFGEWLKTFNFEKKCLFSVQSLIFVMSPISVLK